MFEQTQPEYAEWWAGRGFTPEMQEQFLLSGQKLYEGCYATFPLTANKQTYCFVGRNIDDDPDAPKYLAPKEANLPPGMTQQPLYQPAPIRKGGFFLVEGYIDAMAIAAAGHEAVAIGGTNPGELREQQLRELSTHAGPALIIPDKDETGVKTAREWAQMLYPNAEVVSPITLDSEDGIKDPADYLQANGVEALAERLNDIKTMGGLDFIELACTDIEHMRPRAIAKYIQDEIIPMLAKATPLQVGIIKKQIKKASGLTMSDLDDAWMLYSAKLHAEEEASNAAQVEEPEVIPEPTPLVTEPGVLDRYVKDAAKVKGVVRDQAHMKLLALSALSAQLDKLPNDTPLGTSVVLMGEAGRGKNKVTDGAIFGLPEDWVLAFESASGKALNYMADNNPDLLRHTFLYPNEAEATDMLVEILRPLLSSGRAVHQTVNKNADGANVAQEMTVEGPISVVIPTVRNKLDSQLFTRLLVAELQDYPGRVKEHSSKFTDQLTGEFQEEDHQGTIAAWQEALSSLVRYRKVIIPVGGERFHFSSDNVSHGARVWKNLLSLMLTNAWLEQNNRETRTLADGTKAVVATAEDYRVAYELFRSVCDRTVVNLSDTHVRILDAVKELTDERNTNNSLGYRGGFTYRMIAEKVRAKGHKLSTSTITANKTFLISSAKLLREVKEPWDGDNKVIPGLALGYGVDPEDWATGDITEGLPRPKEVEMIFNSPHLPEPPEQGEQGEQPSTNGSDPHRYAEKPVRTPSEQNGKQPNPHRTVQVPDELVHTEKSILALLDWEAKGSVGEAPALVRKVTQWADDFDYEAYDGIF
jgi:hypothetical protein